ncbi:MAG TPA: tail fiber domain-containing protein [Roseiarcus sp.]|jgi:hypothetical protein
MPSDDLILNVRQIEGYPATGNAIASDAILLQRGGLGGPYLSISPTAFVGTALANGGDLAVGGQVRAASIQAGSAQFSNAAVNLFTSQTACIDNLTATWGSFGTLNANVAAFTSAQAGTLSVSGDMQVGGTANMASAVVQTQLTAGYATVVQTLDAANLNVASLANVCNLIVNGNFAVPNGTATVGGYPIVTSANFAALGFAPLDSPPFTGTPTAPTPSIGPTPPTDNSTAIATTAFVVGVVNQAISSAAFAPLASPNFSGVPSGPTAAPGSSTAQLATTAFVMAAVSATVAGVSSFNGRTGAVVFEDADLTAAGGALLASPVFTGLPSAPTANIGNASGLLATTQFVQNAVAAISVGVTTFNSRSGAVTLTAADITGAGGALASAAGVSSFNGRSGAITLSANDVSAAGALVNPSTALTGVPTAPTAAPATNTNQLATTAFVMAALAAVGAGVISFNGRAGAVNLTLADVTGVNGAPLNSPSFSGVPLAPTAAAATNTNQIATCAWVLNELGGASIGVASFNGRGGAVVLTSADITGAGGALAGAGVASFNSRTGAITLTANDLSAAGGALLASPAFTGTPTSTTASAGTNSTQIATTAFVAAALAAKANLASPAFTGVPTAPSVVWPANTSQIANTATVTAAVSGYLPLVGGTLTGSLNVGAGLAIATNALGSDFQLGGSANVRNLIWASASGYYMQLNLTSGALTWVGNNASIMSLDYNGTLTVSSAITAPVFTAGSAVWPAGNNQQSCGQPGQAWFQVASFNFPNESDPRSKEDMIPAPAGALGKVKALPVHQFRYKTDETRREHVGFNADEVEAMHPHAVFIGEDAGKTKAINLPDMIALLWQAVQELTGEVETLKARMT